jgi:hypothetical protein
MRLPGGQCTQSHKLFPSFCKDTSLTWLHSEEGCAISRTSTPLLGSMFSYVPRSQLGDTFAAPSHCSTFLHNLYTGHCFYLDYFLKVLRHRLLWLKYVIKSSSLSLPWPLEIQNDEIQKDYYRAAKLVSS